MPVPPSVTPRTVVGTYVDGAGVARQGSVTFRLDQPLIAEAESWGVVPTPIVVQLDSTGHFSVVLMASDDLGLFPSGFRWIVQERFTGGYVRTYSFELPSDAEAFNLPTATQYDPGDVGLAVVHSVNGRTGIVQFNPSDFDAIPLAQKGAPGGVATLGSGGTIPPSQLSPAYLQKSNNLSDVASVSTSRNNLGLGSAATRNAGWNPDEVILGDDTRLSNPRTPTAHAASHATIGTDPITPLSIGASATGHVHAGADVTTGTVAYARLPVGTTASTIAAGNDSRLTDQRVPVDLSVTTAKIGDGSVTTVKIADAQVTTAKLADGSVTTAKLVDAQITTAKIIDGQVTSAKIADGTIVNADVNASAAISLSKLAVDPLARANHTGTQLSNTISDLGTAATRNIGTGATNVILGNDTRLTDARTPVAHATSHGSAGSDPVTPAAIGADAAGTATSAVSAHTVATDPHADRAYTDSKFAGALARANNLADVNSVSAARSSLGLGTAAVKDTGTGATNVILGNDARLTDSRTPALHASTHGTAGADRITPAAIGADVAGTAASAVSAHTAATDPHGDRAFTTSAISTHSAATDPHGDRAFTTSAISTHTAATDPHGDRAYATGLAALKLDKTGGTLTGGLVLASTDTGGSDTSDTTSRIDLTSHQSNGSHFYGELIRLNVIDNPDGVGGAKGMIAWRMPRPPSGTDESTLRSVTWMGAHWQAQNDINTIHGHFSIETPDASDALRTRLEILISNQAQTAIGSDKTLILTNQADFVVRCDNNQVLRLKTGSGAIKALEYSNADWGGTGVRWQVRQNGTAESGSNVGSDWEVARFNDSGTEQDVPLLITRSNGKVTIGGTAGTAGSLLVNRASTGSALTVDTYQAGAGGTGTTAYLALTKDVTSRIVNSLVTTDVTSRFVLFADGKHEWGPGGSSSRDTNLYRSAADTLSTDDSLTVGATLTVTTAAVSPIVRGSTASAGTLTLNSTSNATKGKILFGTSAYDEVNNRLGVGNASPGVALDVTGQVSASTIVQAPTLQGGTGSAGTLTLTSTTNATKGKLIFGTSAYDEVNNRLGVGNASPTVPLDVTGNVAISGTLTLGGDAALSRTAAGVITTTAELWRTTPSTVIGAYLAQVSGDAVPRMNILGDGKHEWGDGALTRDVNLYRTAAGVLKTDNSLHVGATFRHLGTTVGFFNTAAAAKPTVTGSRGGNVALGSLLTGLAALGLITDSSS